MYKCNRSTLKKGSTILNMTLSLQKFGHRLLLSLSALSDNVIKRGKNARMPGFMHQSTFRPNCILNNDAKFEDFCAGNCRFTFVNLIPLFTITKHCIFGILNNVKQHKLGICKVWTDLLYFSILFRLWSLPKISNYEHPKKGLGYWERDEADERKYVNDLAEVLSEFHFKKGKHLKFRFCLTTSC